MSIDTNLPAVADPSTLLRMEWRNHWLTPAEYARQLHRPERTVRWWCSSGLLADVGIPHFRDRRGRHWIKYIPS